MDKCKIHNCNLSIRKDHGYNRLHCKVCSRQRVYEFRRNCKKKLVELFGGKCEICGYNKCLRSLEFHHIDPTTKTFTISKYAVVSLNRLFEEIKKCILVCGNCHGEIEDGLILDVSILDRSKIILLIEEAISNLPTYRKRKYKMV